MPHDDLMDFFTDDEPIEKQHRPAAASWKAMIVDDDPSVHEATIFSLQRFTFLGKGIQWISAYSAREARRLLEQETDIALLFLDVVMEDDHAGLEFAKWYREKNINPCTRIILRTGQPGQAPEREIIVNYDLHDYKTKTELTSDKLFTTTVTALRSYHDMNRLKETGKGLEGIIHATASIFKMQTMYEYAKSVLKQIEQILDIRSSGIICAHSVDEDGWKILAETGSFSLPKDEIFGILRNYNESASTSVDENGFMIRILAQDERSRYAIFLEPTGTLSDIQSRMLLMFCNNVSIGLSNIKLYDSLLNANRVTVMSLAQVTESRDHNTGEHVFRIASASELLVRALLDRQIYPDELTEETVAFLGLSSTLHDIGKVTVKDQILLKPGRLTADEFNEIKLHTVKGADILDTVIRNAGESVRYLEMGREIALYHHERWDGNGYPHGLKGREIPIEARITAIVDVFDALTHSRCYKPAYSVEEAREIIKDGSGTLFDPLITEVFLEICDQIDDPSGPEAEENT